MLALVLVPLVLVLLVLLALIPRVRVPRVWVLALVLRMQVRVDRKQRGRMLAGRDRRRDRPMRRALRRR